MDEMQSAKTFYALSDGKICRVTATERGGKTEVLESAVLNSYLTRLRENANRNEWKHSGSGARFTGVFESGEDAETKVRSVKAAVQCLGKDGDELIYAIEIDGMAGIYRRHNDVSMGEGIVLSSGDTAYREFDLRGDDMVVSAVFAGECHIGVCKIGEGSARLCTDGASWDSQPVWSKTDASVIYFSSAGLEVSNQPQKEETPVSPYSPVGIMRAIQASGVSRTRGPAALCRLDIAAGTIEELCIDPAYDYLRPQTAADGSLYYIRRPYREARTAGGSANPFGCLLDILLLPFRLLAALFGFFNFFSMKYSGKTLSNAGDTKRKDEGQMFLDGNLIEAEEELKRNRAKGEKNPGIAPRTWELHRRDADGKDTLVRRGVVAYRLREDGSLLVSNGSAVLSVSPSGEEEKLANLERVTFILD